MELVEKRFERMIANLLRIGVILSAAVVLMGGLAYLVQHGHDHPVYHDFHGEPALYRSITSIVTAATHGDSLAVIQFGLLLLIATPIARVALSLVAFSIQRDRAYVVVTLLVLIILLYSLLFNPSGSTPG